MCAYPNSSAVKMTAMGLGAASSARSAWHPMLPYNLCLQCYSLSCKNVQQGQEDKHSRALDAREPIQPNYWVLGNIAVRCCSACVCLYLP